MKGKALRKMYWDYDFRAHKCLNNNCFGRTFYIVKIEEFLKRSNEKSDEKFRLMLICQKCGAEEIFCKDSGRK